MLIDLQFHSVANKSNRKRRKVSMAIHKLEPEAKARRWRQQSIICPFPLPYELQLSIGSLSKLIFSQASAMWLYHAQTHKHNIQIDLCIIQSKRFQATGKFHPCRFHHTWSFYRYTLSSYKMLEYCLNIAVLLLLYCVLCALWLVQFSFPSNGKRPLFIKLPNSVQFFHHVQTNPSSFSEIRFSYSLDPFG